MPKKPKRAEKATPICGIIMPISAIDGCTTSHWADVLEIFTASVEDAGFEANLVSNAEEVTLIHKTIVQNIYDNPIVVCDVSGKNPNVMFELGMRLAFDKPTIVVKDDKTTYSFDTGTIEHLEYPRDLRFSTIVDFKEKLRDKLSATHKKATTDSTYTTFLKHFGEFKVAKIDKKEVSSEEFVVEELKLIRSALNRLTQEKFSRVEGSGRNRPWVGVQFIDKKTQLFFLKNADQAMVEMATRMLQSHPEVKTVDLRRVGQFEFHIFVKAKTTFSPTTGSVILTALQSLIT
jgi:hypothetical protein